MCVRVCKWVCKRVCLTNIVFIFWLLDFLLLFLLFLFLRLILPCFLQQRIFFCFFPALILFFCWLAWSLWTFHLTRSYHHLFWPLTPPHLRARTLVAVCVRVLIIVICTRVCPHTDANCLPVISGHLSYLFQSLFSPFPPRGTF